MWYSGRVLIQLAQDSEFEPQHCGSLFIQLYIYLLIHSLVHLFWNDTSHPFNLLVSNLYK